MRSCEIVWPIMAKCAAFRPAEADSVEQVPEGFVAETGAANDASQGVWIKSFDAGNCYQPLAVAQHDVFALPDYLKACLPESAHSALRRDIGEQHQTATSIIITFSSRFNAGRAARYSRIPSRMFSIASFSVSPWLWQPGKLGQETS